MIIFGHTPVVECIKAKSYDLGFLTNYPNTTISLATSDFINTTNGGAGGTITINNNILSVNFNGSWSSQQMKVGNIKNLNVSPALPNMELGPIMNSNNTVPNGFYAKIENNWLVFYSPFYLSSVNTTLSTSISGGTSGYSVSLPSLYSCNPTGGGGTGGSISVNNGVATLNMSGGWTSTCNLKTGQIVYLNTTTIANTELGMIKDGIRNTDYRAKIENNWLVFYTLVTPAPLSSSGYMNISKNLNAPDVLLVLNDSNNNWNHAVSYDTKGYVTGASRSYFDDLGKSDINLSKDYVTNKIWGSETTFDQFGRPDKSSFVAPSDLSTFNKVNFFKTATEIAAAALPVDQPIGAITNSQTIQTSNTITATGPISSGLNVNFVSGSITLGNGFSVVGVAGSIFTATISTAPDASANAKLSNYYSDSNTLEPYQATATQPYSKTNYDNLNPGNVINVVGGNQIGGQWKTGYAYTVPAAQEMYYVYGSNYYDGIITSGKEEVITKFYKSVSVDANGIENVAFIDGEGKVLASARSGGTTSYPVISLIGTQGFVDVHIPSGITSGISLIGGASLYKVYDLKTGLVTTSLTGGNAYRIEAITPPATDSKVYITSGVPTNDAGALGVTYNVNYYDYSVNVYNKTGQLIKSIQPNGYQVNTTVVDVPTHMIPAASKFISTYSYNTLGQVIATKSEDEGTSRFAYRKDGQIRYSQSALQSSNSIEAVSYTNYDSYGRAIESGAIYDNNNRGACLICGSGLWSYLAENPDVDMASYNYYDFSLYDQTFTVYDDASNNQSTYPLPTNLTLASVLSTAGLNVSNYGQNNLSGNVAITYSRSSSRYTAINAISWYSYDIYGRTEWVVQYNEGIGAKTIHYYYDYKGNVKKVLYQKDKTAELFAHQYTYDANDVLKKVETSINNSTFITHADYSYYLTGELKRVNLAQGTQGLDYVYTLGGQLKSINHPSLEAAKDPGGDANDVFGITLDYYSGDYLRTGRNITSSPTAGADYNGNIKAARWTNKGIATDYTGGIANQKGYLYDYDRNNWLTGATFGDTNASTAAITPTANYSESGLSYDANGNIKSLRRSNQAGTIVDDLTYNYTNTGKNQLNSLTESAAVTSDPTDIETQSAGNYVYDLIGQMTRNVKEDLYYSYNTQGLVTQVNRGANTVVRFFYNERGQRIKKESYNTASPYSLSSTDYYILDLSGNVMSIYNQPNSGAIVQKDLPIFGLGRLGVCNRVGPTCTYTYEITDHLGNVRAVVSKPSGSLMINSFADYYPFGELLPNRNSNSGNYRYAFQGQELDGETGMEAFQLRLWDGRIGRWLSPDPYGQYSSPYLGMGNNPINGVDINGGIFVPGVIVGGILGGAISAGSQYLATGKIDWSTVAVDTAAGAIVGSGVGLVGGALVASGASIIDTGINKGFGKINGGDVGNAVFSGGVSLLTGGLAKKIMINSNSALATTIKTNTFKTVEKIHDFVKYNIKGNIKYMTTTQYKVNQFAHPVLDSYIGFMGSTLDKRADTYNKFLRPDVQKHFDSFNNSFQNSMNSMMNNLFRNSPTDNKSGVTVGELKLIGISE